MRLYRVLFDTNVLISNLLSSRAMDSATGRIIQAAFDGLFVLLFLDGVIEELDRKLVERPDLSARIPLATAARLVRGLQVISEFVPRVPEPHPAIGRDRKDDFLIAHGVEASADFLISWDKDLLDLHTVGTMRIFSPPEFLAVRRADGLI